MKILLKVIQNLPRIVDFDLKSLDTFLRNGFAGQI